MARELALAGREVIVLEAAESIGTHTSSCNSEVIHAGLYYPRDPSKGAPVHRRQAQAVRVLRGARRPPRRRSERSGGGDESEIPAVESYVTKARANGATDSGRVLDQLHELEPEVRCVAGFL